MKVLNFSKGNVVMEEILKNDLIKIHENLYEIPKSYRSDMRVPAHIFINEQMLEDVIKDKSLWQIINVATLPGIVKAAIAMPDIHQGYGFPIGGVAATDIKNGGVISPGGIGYDINCLNPDTKINLPHGTFLTIDKICDEKYGAISSLDISEKKIRDSKIVRWMKRKESKSLYHIKTKYGYELKATADHPLFNGICMVEAEKVSLKDKIVLYPFSGVPYEEPNDDILVSKSKIIDTLKSFNFENNGNRYGQIIAWLEKRSLLEISRRSWQLPYLIKISGIIFGDGTINIIGKERKGRISIYGRHEDLSQIQADLEFIGVKSKIYQRKRTHTITNAYNKKYQFDAIEYSLHINSTAFAIIMYCLGVPFGNKTITAFKMPSWLHKSPLWQKRLFLAAFFGAEMSTPSTLNKYNFVSPAVSLSKAKNLREDGLSFLNQIKAMLLEFGVQTSSVAGVDGSSRKKTDCLRFHIQENMKNLKIFFSTVSFEYHAEKRFLACYATAYLNYKQEMIGYRRSIRAKVRQLYQQGLAVAHIKAQFVGIPEQFIDHSLWCEGRDDARINFDFISFDEFVKQQKYGKDGFINDEITDIKKIPYDDFVYDVTIDHDDHNFIADNFVVSNCGVRLLASNLTLDEVKPHVENLATAIYNTVPSGVGRGGKLKLKGSELDRVLRFGVQEMLRLGYGTQGDLEFCESNGCMENADPDMISDQAKKRGSDQLGTLGSGNHFLEIQVVDEIYDEQAAQAFKLKKDLIVIMIHCGSRGLGHQVCTDYVRLMMSKIDKWGFKLPDRELVCAPFTSLEGQQYYNAMASACNFAWANRHTIAHWTRQVWQNILGKDAHLNLIYDVSHNIGKREIHEVNGKDVELLVHRKGATRAFGPGNLEIPGIYRHVGQPVLIPGTMGTSSYILSGTTEGMSIAFGTSCHGAGRRLSRVKAKGMVRGSELRAKLEAQGITIRCSSDDGLAEEAPIAYKDVDNVVRVVHEAKIAKKVARFKPVAVIKGG